LGYRPDVACGSKQVFAALKCDFRFPPKISRRADFSFLVEENDDHAAVNLLGVDLNQAERLQIVSKLA
jgi:hypothetical protein